jgi:hypothetical protein
MESSEQSPPEILYHYTSQAGLLGIIESKCIWATEIRYLNDASEFQYFLDLVREVRAEFIDEANEPLIGYSPEQNIISDGISTLMSITTLFNTQVKFPYFVVSFTAQGDLLSQWRAYARDDIGFSIGFSHAKLEQLANRNKFWLVRCTYPMSPSPLSRRKTTRETLEFTPARRLQENTAGSRARSRAGIRTSSPTQTPFSLPLHLCLALLPRTPYTISHV